MKFFIIRHGQASAGQQNYDQLSQTGHTQSVAFGKYLLNRKLMPVVTVTGTLHRHEQTVLGIQEGLSNLQQSDLIKLEQWNEFSHEVYESESLYLQQNDSSYARLFQSAQLTGSESLRKRKRHFMALTGRALKSWIVDHSGRTRDDPQNSFLTFSDRVIDEAWPSTRQIISNNLYISPFNTFEPVILLVSSGVPISILVDFLKNGSMRLNGPSILKLLRSIHNTSFFELNVTESFISFLRENCSDHLDHSLCTLM